MRLLRCIYIKYIKTFKLVIILNVHRQTSTTSELLTQRISFSLMQIISFGNFYLGKDKQSYTKINVHIGTYRLEYERPRFNKNDGTKSTEDSNRRED